MAKKKPTSKKNVDFNELAHTIVKQATLEDSTAKLPTNGKNPHAMALGRLGGLKGGPARAKKLTKKQRKEIAQKAAQVRWNK